MATGKVCCIEMFSLSRWLTSLSLHLERNCFIPCALLPANVFHIISHRPLVRTLTLTLPLSLVPRFAEFVVQALHALSELSGADKASEQFKAAGIDLLKTINAPPKEVMLLFSVVCC